MEFEYGKKMKTAREEKGLSLGDVSFDLKINVNTLKCIEESQTEELPKAPFTKGFIRTYCLYLGLAPGLVLEEYEQTLKVPSTNLKKGILSTEEDAGAFFAFDFFRAKLLPLGTLIVMILGAVATFSYLKRGSLGAYSEQKIERARLKAAALNVKTAQPKDMNVKPVEIKKGVDQVVGGKVEKPEKLTRLATVYKGGEVLGGEKAVGRAVEEELGKAEKPAPKERKPLVVFKNTLLVEPLAKTSLYIKTNLDEKYIRASLKPDVLRKFKFDEATIKFLDAGAVNLILNGKDVGALGIFGEVKTIKFPSMEEL